MAGHNCSAKLAPVKCLRLIASPITWDPTGWCDCYRRATANALTIKPRVIGMMKVCIPSIRS